MKDSVAHRLANSSAPTAWMRPLVCDAWARSATSLRSSASSVRCRWTVSCSAGTGAGPLPTIQTPPKRSWMSCHWAWSAGVTVA